MDIYIFMLIPQNSFETEYFSFSLVLSSVTQIVGK